MIQNARFTTFTISELKINLLIQYQFVNFLRLTDFINVSLEGLHLIICPKRKEIACCEKIIGACEDIFRIAISLFLSFSLSLSLSLSLSFSLYVLSEAMFFETRYYKINVIAETKLRLVTETGKCKMQHLLIVIYCYLFFKK